MTPTPTADPYDLVGVGFGPANLALAIALEERAVSPPTGRALRHRFLERQPGFGWHRGMLIDDATMQVSFLKDLATMRNPTSPFTFIAYLHDQGRLAEFVNYKTFYPLRVEFHDYLEWAAERLSHAVTYSCDVTSIQPVLDAGILVGFDVVASTGTLRTTDVVVATGLEPHVPAGLGLGDRVWHSSTLLPGLDGLDGAGPIRRVVVVGGGQSGAEVTALLHDRFPLAEVHAVVSRFGYAPADDSPFANQIFDPAAVELYHEAPDHLKRQLLADHRNTNYSVVDQDLIVELYRRTYRESVTGHRRLTVHNLTRVVDLDAGSGDGPVTVTVDHLTGETPSTITADLVVLATGYRPVDPLRLLGPAASLCRLDRAGRVVLDRNCRADLTVASRARLFVQGPTEHSHGIASTLLSVAAVRAGWIADALTTSGEGADDPAQVPAEATQ